MKNFNYEKSTKKALERATIKSYTDFSQSETLSKILPFESADFCYYKTGVTDNWMGIPEYQFEPSPHKDYSGESIGCWSLAALLEEIPEIIDFDDDESDYELKVEKENNLYYLSYSNILEYGKIEIEPQENFVDACYEMILKLNELKML